MTAVCHKQSTIKDPKSLIKNMKQTVKHRQTAVLTENLHNYGR